MIYLIGISVFLFVILILVIMILTLNSFLVLSEAATITINDNPEKSITTKGGKTLLTALSDNGILLPSACGGKGACGMCKCVVDGGGKDILPTELAHISKKEKKEDIRLACQLKIRESIKIEIPDEIFNIVKFEADVLSNDNVATFIKLLVLKLKKGQFLDFKAGKYMQIEIPPYEIELSQYDLGRKYRAQWKKFGFLNIKAKSEEEAFRAYSLANPPSEKEVLKFTVRMATPPVNQIELPPGVGSSYIFNLKPGDHVELSGPYGDFFVQKTDREICFLGGGAGMAPMRSHILDQLETVKTRRKITFWYGARSLQEMFFDEEFTELDEKYDNFTYRVALSDPQPEDNWNGLKGFIHQSLCDNYLKDHDDPGEIEYYLCGPPPMIDAVIRSLDDLGVEPDMIHYDKF